MTRREQLADLDALTSRLAADTDALDRRLRTFFAENFGSKRATRKTAR